MRAVCICVLFAIGLASVPGPLLIVWLSPDSTRAIACRGLKLTWYEGVPNEAAITVSLNGGPDIPPGFTAVPMPDFENNEPPFVGTIERWARVHDSTVPIGALSFLIWLPAVCLLYRGCVRKEWANLIANPVSGGCHQCGYDLERNESGRCPECGSAVQSPEIHAVCGRCETCFAVPLANWRSDAACDRCSTPLTDLSRRSNTRIRNGRVARASLVMAAIALFPGTAIPFVGPVLSIASIGASTVGRRRIARSPKRYGGSEFSAVALTLSLGAVLLNLCSTVLVVVL